MRPARIFLLFNCQTPAGIVFLILTEKTGERKPGRIKVFLKKRIEWGIWTVS